MHTRRAGHLVTRPLNCGVMRVTSTVHCLPFKWRGAVAMALVASSVAGCCSPMSCKPAVVGMERYAPLVRALASFQNDNGTYPDSLEQLVPTYLPALPKGDANQRPSDPEYGASGRSFF